MKPNNAKPPVPKYHYKLVTVQTSREAGAMETVLRDRLRNLGLSFFTICRPGESCDVMGDSGQAPLASTVLAEARAVATQAAGARG